MEPRKGNGGIMVVVLPLLIKEIGAIQDMLQLQCPTLRDLREVDVRVPCNQRLPQVLEDGLTI